MGKQKIQMQKLYFFSGPFRLAADLFGFCFSFLFLSHSDFTLVHEAI